jgi:predicted amidohydrolase
MMRRMRSWLPFLTLLSAVSVVGWSSPTAGANDDYAERPTIVRVAAVQINSVLFDNATNLANMIARTEEAAANGAQLIVFPECAVNGYKYANLEEALPYAEELPGPSSAVLADRARELGVYIAYGVIEREGINVYDTAALVGPEGYIGKYRKAHMGFQSEALLFTRDAGSGFPVFQTAIGRIALGICYDGTMPETVRVPALRGVDIFAFVYSGGGGSTTHYMLSRAEENNMYVVQAARLGPQRLSMADGYSGIFAPGWKTLAMASKSGEEIVYADVDLSLLSRSWRDERRPAFYGPVARLLPREIQALELYPESHVYGNGEKVFVRIVTASVQTRLPVRVQFLLGGVPMVRAAGRLRDSTLTLPVTLPASLPVGDYEVRLTINGEQALTKVGHYTVKAFPYPHAKGHLPNRPGAAAKGTIYVGYDMDVVPSKTVPATLSDGVSTINLTGSINVAADGIDNRLAIPYPTLKTLTTYTVNIPPGAVQAASGVGNDPLSFTFTTARPPLMVKTAVAQTNPLKGGNAANLEAMLAKLDEAKAGGAQLVVFPELALSGAGFASKGEALPFAEKVPGPAVEAMTARAQELGLYAAFGLLERASKFDGHGMHWGRHHPNTVLYSTFVLVGPEGVLGKYRKVHLSQPDRAYLEEGDMPFPTFDTASIGKVGLMLGDDVRFPEVVRVQLAQDAPIIAAGGNVTDAIWREMVLNRCSESLLYIAAANRIGSEGGVQYAGNSVIAGLYRLVYASAGPDAEQLVMANLNIDSAINKIGLQMIDRVTAKNYGISYTLDRRPELYGPLTWDCMRGSPDHASEHR